MRFNIIGAGRLGKNIALALTTAKIATLQSVLNLSLKSGKQSCLEIGSGTAVSTIDELGSADIIWITCNDDAIHSVANILAKSSLLKPGVIVIHSSGVLNSTILSSLRDSGCYVASFHPLKAFMSGYLDAHSFNSVVCVLEGDGPACTWLYHSFKGLGADIISILPEAKATYHAAACIASNYLITLASCSEQLLLSSGIVHTKAREILLKLMQGNLNNVQEKKSIADALTGPLMRGDEETLLMHLQAINNPVIKELYKAAGLATLPLTQLPEAKKNSIVRLLT